MEEKQVLWWYRSLDADQAVGPLERHSLEALIKEGTIDRSMMIREGSDGPWVVASANETFAPLFITVLDLPVASPSHRFFARIFDIWVLSVCVIFPLSYVLGLYSATYVRLIESPGMDKLSALLFLPVILFVEALIVGFFGNTPGKWLMGVKVVDYRGNPLTTVAYLKRNLRVWFSGLAVGVPIFGLATMYYQWNKLVSKGSTSYDFQLKTQVRKTGTSVPKVLTFICVAVGVFLIIGWVNTINREFDYERSQALAKPDYKWTNPLSGESVMVPGVWSLSTKDDPRGNPIYTFSEVSGRGAIIFAYENLAGYTIETYSEAVTISNKSFFTLVDSGEVSLVNNIPTWVAHGHGIEDSSVNVTMEIRKFGNVYWRLIIIQSPPKGATEQEIGLLKLQLLSTLSNQLG